MSEEKVTSAPEKMLLIPASTAQAILNYLGKCPCGDVYAMVTALLGLKEAPVGVPPLGTIVELPPGVSVGHLKEAGGV